MLKHRLKFYLNLKQTSLQLDAVDSMQLIEPQQLVNGHRCCFCTLLLTSTLHYSPTGIVPQTKGSFCRYSGGITFWVTFLHTMHYGLLKHNIISFIYVKCAPVPTEETKQKKRVPLMDLML